MLKAVVAATAAVTIAGSSFAYAQPQDRRDGSRRWQPTTEDIRAFQAARLAGLRAGLGLNADQETHWPAFEQAMRELQQLRLSRVAAMREARREGRPPVTDPAERMRQRAARLAESGAVLKRLADATDPLYRSLDDAQKRRFAILTRTTGPRGWQRPGRDGGEPGLQRGHRRTDAAPADAAPQFGKSLARKTMDGETAGPVFSRKMVDGEVFAQAFVSKTVDGVMVGRVFGTKTVNGDLAIGEAALFTGKTLEPVVFGAKVANELTVVEPGIFSAKLTTAQPRTFSRKITIGEPPVFGRKAVTSI
jgi:LTXXQ motif family protein